MTQFKDKSARGGQRSRLGRAVHLPGAAGRRHPALPARPGAGRRGPAPAPRAQPRPGPALQQPVRRDLRRARAAHPQADREDLRPADRREADEQEHRRQRLSSGCSTTRSVIEKKIKSAVTDTGREVRFDPEGKPGRQQPAHHPVLVHRRARRRARAALRGQRLRRPEEGRRRGRARLRGAVPVARAWLHRRPGHARRRTRQGCGPRPRGRVVDARRPSTTVWGSCRRQGLVAREERPHHRRRPADPGALRQRAQAHRESFGDTLAASIPTHITLLPPTPVPADELDMVEEHLRKVAEGERSFEIHLRGTGTFHPVSPVVFVSVAMGISDCERVEARRALGPARPRAVVPLPPARDGRPRPPDGCPRARVRRAGRLRRALPGRGIQPLRTWQGRRVAPAARLLVRAANAPASASTTCDAPGTGGQGRAGG